MSLRDDIKRAAVEASAPRAQPEDSGPVTMLNYDIDRDAVPTLRQLNPTPADFAQLEAAQQHARLVAKYDAWDKMPEGGLAGLANKCSPTARKMHAISRELGQRLVECNGRVMPFEKKVELPKLDELDQRIVDRDAFEEAVVRLNERMDTQAQQERLNAEPLSMRDYVTAAVDTAAPQGE